MVIKHPLVSDHSALEINQSLPICILLQVSFRNIFQLPVPRNLSKFKALCKAWGSGGFSQWGTVSLPPNTQTGGLPFVHCLKLLIQYIHSFLPYMETLSSIHNLTTYHETHLTLISFRIIPILDWYWSFKTYNCCQMSTSPQKNTENKSRNLLL
jgi:hypothetical protein